MICPNWKQSIELKCLLVRSPREINELLFVLLVYLLYGSVRRTVDYCGCQLFVLSTPMAWGGSP